MGARASRLTREGVITPPEFRLVPQHDDPTGRVGGARIELTRRGAETVLSGCYQQIPLRMMPPFSFTDEPAALLYLITLTAGLMDNDAHLIDLSAGPGTNALVTGQSATRIHPALKSFATQQWKVDVAEEATLVVLPGPAIPFRKCRFYQRGRVDMAPTSRLIWGDIWLAGRYDRGELSERYAWDRIVQDFEVRRNGRLVYRDRFRWDGPWSSEDISGYFGGELACASLFIGGPLPDNLPDPHPQVRRAVFPLDNGESCIRWVGHPMVLTPDVVRLALSVAGMWTGGKDARPWLLESTDLTPNHWFSMPPADEVKT